MEQDIKSGKHFATNADLSGSAFRSVNLSDAVFDDINLGQARFHDVNFGGARISAANFGGAVLRHLGPPNDATGRQPRQKPVTIEEAMLCDSTFRKVDLSNVRIIDCNIEGMTIDDIPVAEMRRAYDKRPR